MEKVLTYFIDLIQDCREYEIIDIDKLENADEVRDFFSRYKILVTLRACDKLYFITLEERGRFINLMLWIVATTR